MAKELVKSGKYLIDPETNQYYKPTRHKGLYSKIVVITCILLAIGYTGICLLMQWKTGTQPEPQLTIAFFGFVTVELWNLAKIKRSKKGDENENHSKKDS